MKTKTEARRQRILDVATEIFAETGFERASMSEISARVGGSKATLYNYFPSKEKLFLEVMINSNHAQFEEVQQLLTISEESIRDVLQRFGEALVILIYSNDVLAVRRLVIAESVRSDLGYDCYRRSRKQGEKEIAQQLSLASEQGQLKNQPAELMTSHLLCLLESEFIDRMVHRSAPPLEAEQVTAAVGRALDVFLGFYGVESYKFQDQK